LSNGENSPGIIPLIKKLLGLDPRKLEGTLESYLRRAERWNAIVLIDEADVFMSKRSESTTHEKEALVAGNITHVYKKTGSH
jgi:CO dehydrogenase/acetyl-CoA synthase alpha subunit